LAYPDTLQHAAYILDGSFSLSVLVSVLTMNAVLWKRLGLLDMRS